MRAELSARDTTIGELEEALGHRDGRIAALSGELEVAREELEQTSAEVARIARLEADMGERDVRMVELERQLAATGGAVAHAADLASRLGERESQLRELERVAAALTEQTAELEAELTACAEHASSLEAQLAAEGPVAEVPDKETAMAMVARIAARTRGSGPRVDDDLKKIHGVGPKLEKLLKGFDITSFRQVAHFTIEDIAFVTAALEAFPGRIARDDWMSSAADEHLKKYGEPV